MARVVHATTAESFKDRFEDSGCMELKYVISFILGRRRDEEILCIGTVPQFVKSITDRTIERGE